MRALAIIDTNIFPDPHSERQVTRMRLATLPRIPLANLPTPLEELPRPSQELGSPRLFIKRDDETGLGFGGNKTRKLEYLLGDAALVPPVTSTPPAFPPPPLHHARCPNDDA